MENSCIWNWRTTKNFKTKIHNNLLHDYHVYNGLRQFTTADEEFYEVFFAKKYTEWVDNKGNERKETVTYAIDPKVKQYMPIKVDNNKTIKGYEAKNIVYMVNPSGGFTSFRIKPEKKMSYRRLINYPNFKHTNQLHDTLFKIVALTTITHRIFVGVASNSHFGKDSYVTTLNDLTSESPIAEMGSTAAMLRDLNPRGCLWFNETNSLTQEMKRVCENLIMKAAAGQTTFKNEKKASAAHKTKDVYDIEDMSIGFLYNNASQYRDLTAFFDNIWKNKDAVSDRLLRLKFDGRINERFTKNYDHEQALLEAEPLFRDVLKSIHYYKKYKGEDHKAYKYPIPKEVLGLSDRQYDSFEQIVHNIDRYCESQEEFNEFFLALYKCKKDYDEMNNDYSIDEDSSVSTVKTGTLVDYR